MNVPALLVSYYFPPMGGAGTQRFAKFARYLPDEGITPVVVAAGASADPSAPHADASLEGDLPAGLAVHRVPVRGGRDLAARVRDAVGFTLDGTDWARDAAPVACEAARTSGARVVVTTVSPYAVWRVGAEVRERAGIPWILDLRDPWALDGWRRYSTPLHAAYDLRQMRRALRAADAVVANTSDAADAYAALGVRRDRIAVIPNGWDAADFAAPPRGAAAEESVLRIVHVGTLHAAEASPRLRGERLPKCTNRRVAYEGRSAGTLLRAMARLLEVRPEIGSRVRLDLCGEVDPSNLLLAARLGIAGQVSHRGYVPHADAVDGLRTASVVFVPLHDVPAGERALVVPAKLYEALASGRPVLAALPPGDAADLVRASGRGVVAGPLDVEGVAAGIEALASGAPGPDRGESVLARFERRRLARDLAGAVRAVLAGTAVDVGDPFAAARDLARA